MMKNLKIKIFSFGLCAVLLFSVFSFCVSASPAILALDKTSKVYTVGENVNVTVKLSAGENIYTVMGNLTYNAKVLKYVSGGDDGKTSGVVKIVDETIAENPVSTVTYTITLQAIAAGSSYIGIDIYGVNIDLKKISDSQGATITVKAPTTSSSKPTASSTPSTPTPSASTPTTSSSPSTSSTTSSASSNANLSSLSVSAAALEPAFSADVTEYKVTVSNDVVSCSIAAKAAQKNAKVSGTGDVSLNVGDNSVTVTVTAKDGTKKNYTVNIYRQTEEETAAAFGGGNISPDDPLAVTVGDATLKIVADISALYIPEGYSLQTETRGEHSVHFLKENDGEKILYYLSDASGANAKIYAYDAAAGFQSIRYITVSGKMYILVEFEEDFVAPSGYYESVVHLADADIEAFKYEDENLSDFYILYCYADGELAFYRYDTFERSIQRAPEFKPNRSQNADANKEDKENFFTAFSAMTTQAKTIIILLATAIVCFLILIALLIVKIASKATTAEPTVFDPGADKKPFEKEDVYNGFNFDDN